VRNPNFNYDKRWIILQRLNGNGLREIINLYDGLRYSLDPLEKVLISFKKVRSIIRGNAY